MTIDRLPGVYYDENVTYELNGVGSKIPVFIGRTGNSAVEEVKNNEGVVTTKGYYVDGKHVLTFDNYADINKVTTDGGIGTETTTTTVQKTVTIPPTEEGGESTTETVTETQVTNNLETNVLLKRIKEFYEEARLLQSGDIGVPYIYVIDVGNGNDINVWKEALKTAKSLHDATVEVYVGASIREQNDTRKSVLCGTGDNTVEITDFLSMVYSGTGLGDLEEYGLETCAKNLDLRYAFTTVDGANDDDLISLTKDKGFKKSRIGIAEPLLFGKTIARICCTPNNTEPGYYKYRSVTEKQFLPRTKHDMLALQNAGIIFNRDEHINGNIYPKMNLCVATSFAETTGRPADALFHARFNADDLLREVFEACYSQVKNNESATNIMYLQTRINKIVNDRVTSEEMVKYNDRTQVGTKLYVSESTSNPYDIIVSGQIQPVKCTIAIEVTATIKI